MSPSAMNVYKPSLCHVGAKPCYRYMLARAFHQGRINLASIHSLNELPPRIKPQYKASPNSSSLHSLVWETPPRNIFFVKKPWDSFVRDSMLNLMKTLNSDYPDINIMVEPDVAEEISKDLDDSIKLYQGTGKLLYETTDLLITLGGDGTILNATSLFARGEVPPVLSFSLGTLGFLLPFDIKDASRLFNQVYSSQSKALNRIRLTCEKISTKDGLQIKTHAMNDINIYRGQDPHLTLLEIEANDQHVTQAIADGVIVSTPTGSTAYSLSAGGSIVHPDVKCILITPICPRSLSFRPLIFPESSKIKISMSPQSRGRLSEFSVDGISQGTFHAGDSLIVESEKGANKGIWCIANNEEDWVHNINGLLGFNSRFGGLKSRH